MAVRIPDMTEDITISVYLKNGTSHLNKDITNQPFGESERIVSFWDEDFVVTYPMSEVCKIEFNFN